MQQDHTQRKLLIILTIMAIIILAALAMLEGSSRYSSENSAPKKIRERALKGRMVQPKPKNTYDMVMSGKASWYGVPFHGRTTANGEKYNMYLPTAAHKTLPFGSIVHVTNLKNGKSTYVRINDRGPYIAGRNIDLSYYAAEKLGMVNTGVASVKLEVMMPKRKSKKGSVIALQ